MVTRHEFLAELHRILVPTVYLEIGVQHGTSMALAGPGCWAVGVDPDPQLRVPVTGHVEAATSDGFFVNDPAALLGGPIDLAFIDGMHLFEYALRDFMNVERLAHPDAVVVFDDVLPRNQAEAARTQCPGDWTGDVWRIHPYLAQHRPDLDLTLVDTQPTGLLIVRNLQPGDTRLGAAYIADHQTGALYDAPPVPEHVLTRQYATAPADALRHIEERASR